MKRALTLTLALLFVGVSGAVGQAPDRDAPRGPGSRGPAFMGRGLGDLQRYNPGIVLRHQAELSLSEAQVEQLTRLNTEAVTSREQGRIAFESQRAQLAEALASSEPDMRAARAHFDSAQAAMSNLQWAGIGTALQARAVLTEEQQLTVRELRAGSARGRPGRARRPRR